MELLPLLCLCLLTHSGITSAQLNGPAVITVEGGTDVMLPCSLSTKENIESKLFDWRKVAQKDDVLKEVFLYDAGSHYNNGLDGQSEQFKGRVSHFQDELKHGNASIIIRNTKISDSGEYTCYFPNLQPRQLFHIELVVEPNAKVTVGQDSDVMLPCSLSTKENIEFKLFDWKKVSQKDDVLKEVFLYDGGIHYNNGRGGQSEEFKGRVSHFQDELKHANASIIIRNTTVTDSGVYTCHFSRLQPPQIFYIELVVDPKENITVEQDSDVMLPCSPSTKENIESELFDWKTLPQKNERRKEVFMYNDGIHYNNDYRSTGQSDEFKRRVSHFQDELKHGNASIIIRHTKLSDSGVYICDFPNLQPPQKFYIKLVVGAAQEPSITSLKETKDWRLLQCEVHGNPEPEVEWQDSAGNILNAEEPQVKKIGGLFYVTLNTTVTKTDRYRCVATQETISHQVYAETDVHISGTLQLSVKTVSQTNDRALLQCEVRGASADLRVEWQDSAGNQLAAKEPQLSERGGGDDVTLQTTVTKTGHYHCVASQKKSNHTISEDTFVHISEPPSEPTSEPPSEPTSGFTGWMIGLIVAVVILFLLLLAAVVLAVLVHKGYITLNCNKVITVEEGSDVTLPCSLWPKKDLRSEVFIWQKTDSLQMVFLYDNGDLYSDKLGGQNEQFKGRVSHFPDELEQGNASIIIRNTTRADNGYYTCIVSSIQKKEKKKKPQIFNIKLDVVVGSTRKKEHRSLMI